MWLSSHLNAHCLPEFNDLFSSEGRDLFVFIVKVASEGRVVNLDREKTMKDNNHAGEYMTIVQFVSITWSHDIVYVVT